MKAMILAGGMSTRLYPLTKELPKPLVPVAGEPNCAHVIRYLQSFGILEIAINVHYHAEMVKNVLGDGSKFGVTLTYLDEDRLMGSAGAVKQMEPFFDETFVVVGCDDLTDLNLDRLIDFHRRAGALATIALVQADDVSQYGVVVVDEKGKIVEFQEKPEPGTEKSHFVNTGIYVFEPGIFDRIPANVFYDFGKNVFPALQAEGAAFYGQHVPGAYWCDIGTPSEYRRATADVLSGRVRLLGKTRVRGLPPGAPFGEELVIEGDVRVGEGVRFGKRVHVRGPAVLGDGVHIDDDALIDRSIVWDGSQIGARAHVVDSIVGISYRVPADTTLDNLIVANEPAEAAT
jgi:mannose-1-phosphate guanylyltransferase/mannose-1-phosphate guanylyltransferase/phosphomannomutase